MKTNNNKKMFLYNNVAIWQNNSSKRRILWCKKPMKIWDVMLIVLLSENYLELEIILNI